MKINFNNNILERFIPIELNELKNNFIEEDFLDKNKITTLYDTLQYNIHQKFYTDFEKSRINYSPFNPDKDTVSIQKYEDQELQNIEDNFLHVMRDTLNKANYEKLGQKELHNSINEKSPYGVEVSIDFDYFENIELYFRGSSLKTQKLRTLKSLYLKKEEHSTKIYRRLFILYKTKEKPNQIFIKLFKNIPSNDLDMLFPNTKVKMTLLDKIKLFITGGGGTAGGAFTLMGKVAVLIDPIALLTAIGAFIGILWRQIKSVFNHRVKYMAKLSKNLYFYNLGNNEGVISYLNQSAQEEEIKEAFLAALFLIKEKNPLTAEELDKKIELYIQKKYDVAINFEIEDALLKLSELNMVTKEGNRFRAF